MKIALALAVAACAPEPVRVDVVSPPPSIETIAQRMSTASRTEGAAPLAVVFDPTGGSTGVVQPDAKVGQAAFSYLWDFGDADSGEWEHNGKSRNQSVAWIGAHVYERPGKYRVTLTVIDAEGTAHDYRQDIVVKDADDVFGRRTYHVAANGKDSNAGSRRSPLRSIEAGLRKLLAGNRAGRLLLRRGDAWKLPSNSSLGRTEAALQIGAYGEGDRPRIEFTGTDVGFDLTQAGDVRLHGLELVSTSTTQPDWAVGVNLGHRSLVLDCVLRGFGSNIHVQQTNEGVVCNSQLLDSKNYGLYAFGANDAECRNLAVIGNLFDGTGQHLLRTYTSRSLIQANRFARANVSAMKLCGRPQPDPSHHVCVMDNHVQTEVIADMVGIGPENRESDQHTLDYQIEGNRFVSREEGNNCVQLRGSDMVVRNNVFDVMLRRAIRIEQWGVGPVPRGVIIENNTAYSVSGKDVKLVWAKTADRTIVRNNVMFCPGGKAEAPTGTVVAENNVTKNPRFVDAAKGDFRLSRRSPAAGAGKRGHVRFDFDRQARPTSARVDAGAFQRR